MTRIEPPAVTFTQWTAVLAIWGLAAYGALGPSLPSPPAKDLHLIACR